MTGHNSGTPLGAWLADLPDERLIRLLELRPDLTQPPPGSIAALAARAQSRQSVKAATDEQDFLRLAVLDALLTLHADTTPVELGKLTALIGDRAGEDAVAAGTLHTRADVVELIATGGLPKGDALATARVAGILAAKRTSELIPLCHQLALTGVDVDFEIGQAEVGITATVRSTDRTGVEMEALTAVSVAALTLYDMLKAVDPAARIDDIRVLRKEGGKTGLWQRP